MLSLENVNVAYNKDKAILSGVSFEVAQGKTYGILGMNGAGKTTLFKAIYGNVDFSGEIKLHGVPLKTDNVAFLETHIFLSVSFGIRIPRSRN